MDTLYYHGKRLIYAVHDGEHVVADGDWGAYLAHRHEVPQHVVIVDHRSDVLAALSGDHERPSQVMRRAQVMTVCGAIERATKLLVNERWYGGDVCVR